MSASNNQAHRPLFSIVTVCYNNLDCLKLSYESLVKQPSDLVEWVVVDGDSQDGTKHWLASLNTSGFHMRSEPDKGIYDAMNKGIEMSSGRYIFFLNAGDTFYSDNALLQIKEDLISNQFPMVLTCPVHMVYTEPDYSFDTGYPLSKKILAQGHMPAHQGTFVDRDLLKSMGGFDLSYRITADFELLCRLEQAGASSQHLETVCCNYMAGGVSSFDIRSRTEKLQVVRKYFGFGPGIRYWFRAILLGWYPRRILQFLELNQFYRTLLKLKQIGPVGHRAQRKGN